MAHQSTETNGAGPQAPIVTREMMDHRLDEILFPVLNSVIMGCKVTMLGPPPDMMLYAVARTVGRIMGLQFGSADNLGVVLRCRKECIDQFDSGVKSIKPQMTPQQPSAMTAIPANAK